ncbi:MAG TPA: aspartyl protease family protein, partial [Candidatus Tumulicola sp.]
MRPTFGSRAAFASSLTIACILCAVSAAPALDKHDAALDAAPTGLVPSSAKLSDVLAAHDRAVGNAAAEAGKTVAERWIFTSAGIAGTETLERSGLNYHSRIAEGPFVEEYGQYQGTRWHQDANGFTSATSEIDARSFYAVRVLEDAADPKNDVTILGETTGAQPAWVFQIKRPGYRHPEWIFYDKASAQVVRVEFVSSRRRIVETYDDFRTTDGFVQAWHIRDTDGRPELDDDWSLQSVRHGVPLSDAIFQMPPHRPTVSHVTAATDIPDRTTRAGFVVRVNLDGRGLDFLLDSASDESILDRNVAHDLNLPTYGQTTKLADGRPVTYRTTLADADVAGIHLRNFTVSCSDFAYDPDSRIRIVGVLGYDFFAANVLHFDFANGRIEALPTPPFTQAAPVAGGIEIPLTIDDGVPLVPMYVGNTLATAVVLDTALPFSLISGTFAAEHPADVVDRSHGDHASGMVP